MHSWYEVDQRLKAKLSDFRSRKETNHAAILMKFDQEKTFVLEKEYEDISVDELRAELPEKEPRFMVYSAKYVHADGMVSYPPCFIFFSPVGSVMKLRMIYSANKDKLVKVSELKDVFETENPDELTEEWLRKQFAYLG